MVFSSIEIWGRGSEKKFKLYAFFQLSQHQADQFVKYYFHILYPIVNTDCRLSSWTACDSLISALLF